MFFSPRGIEEIEHPLSEHGKDLPLYVSSPLFLLSQKSSTINERTEGGACT